jgi:hypothetical protein
MKGANIKLKSFATIALLSMLLLFPTIAVSSGEPSSITLQYDRDDPDIGHSGTDPLAVRFTPPRIWLGMGYVCTLFKVTAIRLHVSSDSWIWNAGFDVRVTDENHQTLKSFMDQHPTDIGWFSVDLSGWTDSTCYVETHFFVEFAAHAPAEQESWAILDFDEANVDEGEPAYLRSYRYTYSPENPNTPAWLPIELTYPYGPGDLMIRVELEPQTPNSFLPSLITEISEANPIVFKGKAASTQSVLIKKINEAMLKFEKGNYDAGFNKLENDIAQKLADPRPTPATSWLKTYPVDTQNQKLVTSFAVVCHGIVQMAQKSASPPGVPESCDFNNDGYDDLAIGVPHENVGGKDNAGAVNVLYGSPDGITEENDQYFRQGINGVKGESHTDDMFGIALAIGDFNNDGYADLAAGSPGDDACNPEQETVYDVGSVSVLYGSAGGLTEEGDQQWAQMYITLNPYSSENYDEFGSALAVGDFNGDGYDDLAVGVPHENSEDIDSGEVDVLYGSSVGLTASGNQVWTQDSLEGAEEYRDRFGWTLTVGDFNGDGFEDLAIGVPYEHVGDIDDAGAVNIVYGSITGLTVAGNQIWHEDSDPLISLVSETEDFYGASLTSGDFNADGYDDLAVGIPGEGEDPDSGLVHILHGSSNGLSAAGNEVITAMYWIREECTEFENFGASLAAGDFDHDGFEDLAVGVPKADINWEVPYSDAGAVFVTYGSSIGFLDPLSNPIRWDIWLEIDVPFFLPAYEFNDNYFGWAVTAGDFNGNTCCDLAIGVPMADPTPLISNNEAGIVNVIYGFPSGLSTDFFSNWWQDKPGVDGESETSDYFGESLPGSHGQRTWP